MCEHRALGLGEHAHRVVGDDGGLGLPVGQHFGAGAVGQVVLRVQHVAAPGVGDRGRALGDRVVALDLDLDVHQVGQLAEIVAGLLDDRRIARC